MLPTHLWPTVPYLLQRVLHFMPSAHPEAQRQRQRVTSTTTSTSSTACCTAQGQPLEQCSHSRGVYHMLLLQGSFILQSTANMPARFDFMLIVSTVWFTRCSTLLRQLTRPYDFHLASI